MASFPRALARLNGHASNFASRSDIHDALQAQHLKPSELQLLFRCSRGSADKLMARSDFPKPFDVTGDGHNMRYVYDEVIAFRDSHRRVIRALAVPPPRRPRIAPAPSAEAAVRSGLAALRGANKGDSTQFR